MSKAIGGQREGKERKLSQNSDDLKEKHFGNRERHDSYAQAATIIEDAINEEVQ